MAARKQRSHPDIVRKRIQTSQLINRLQNNAFSERPIMDASQVQCARILLNKTLPDLQSVELSGNANKPIIAEVRQVIVDPEHSDS